MEPERSETNSTEKTAVSPGERILFVPRILAFFENGDVTNFRLKNQAQCRICWRIQTNKPLNCIVTPASGLLSVDQEITGAVTLIDLPKSREQSFIIQTIPINEEERDRIKPWDDSSLEAQIQSQFIPIQASFSISSSESTEDLSASDSDSESDLVDIPPDQLDEEIKALLTERDKKIDQLIFEVNEIRNLNEEFEDIHKKVQKAKSDLKAYEKMCNDLEAHYQILLEYAEKKKLTKPKDTQPSS